MPVHPSIEDDIFGGAVDHALSTTRAIRRRFDLERPVDPSLVIDCIRIATQAPSGGAMQRGRWIVVTDPEQRRRLADLYRRADDGFFESMVASSSEAQARIYRSARDFVEVLAEVPVLVVPCGVVDPGHEPASHLEIASWYGGLLPAVWSMMIALRARGLGSLWTTLHLRLESEAAEVLGLPGHVRQLAMIPVGYTIGTAFGPARRMGTDEVVHLERWTT